MGKRLKIAVWYNLPSGGSKRALFDHISGLKQRGHEIKVWRPPILQESFSKIASLVPEVEIPLEVLPEGSNYVDRIVRHVLRSRMLLRSMAEHSRSVAREIDAGGFDVLFANTDMYFAMPFVGRYAHLPSAVYLGEPRRQFYEAFPEYLWMALPREIRTSWTPGRLIKRIRDALDTAQSRIEAREEFENAKAYTKILVNSLYSRESVLRAYGLDSDVCYLGIDTERFKNLNLARERFVVGMGTVAHPKNLILAVQVIAALPAPRPPLVWIANMADPVYLNQVRDLAKSLDVDFQFLDHIPDDQVCETLNRASVMLYTSRLEPFGLAPLEANACALPVVGVRQGGVRETIEEGVNGLLGSDDVQDLAKSLGSLLENPGRARQLGMEGERLVRNKWSLESGIDRIEAALQRTAYGFANERNLVDP